MEPFSPFLAQQVALCLRKPCAAVADGSGLVVSHETVPTLSIDLAVGASCTLFLLPAAVKNAHIQRTLSRARYNTMAHADPAVRSVHNSSSHLVASRQATNTWRA